MNTTSASCVRFPLNKFDATTRGHCIDDQSTGAALQMLVRRCFCGKREDHFADHNFPGQSASHGTTRSKDKKAKKYKKDKMKKDDIKKNDMHKN
jgi:hypothetical protein